MDVQVATFVHEAHLEVYTETQVANFVHEAHLEVYIKIKKLVSYSPHQESCFRSNTLVGERRMR
ncbi:hypothetical protein SAMN05428962_4609 [Paenibacillus sp. BC26]|nr:hypothetical protein SAMN05428962_4609 [Paenibacillus sp. BC26]